MEEPVAVQSSDRKALPGHKPSPALRPCMVGDIPADQAARRVCPEGEKASGLVVFWFFEEARPVVNDQGDGVLVMSQRESPLVRYYWVFNLSQ